MTTNPIGINVDIFGCQLTISLNYFEMSCMRLKCHVLWDCNMGHLLRSAGLKGVQRCFI